MEQQTTFMVFSMLADTVVYTGNKSACEDYVVKHSHGDDSLYIIRS